MTRPALILLLLVSACGTSAPPADSDNKMTGSGVTGSAPAAAPVPGASPTDLTGLYERKSGETVNQLCMIAKGPDRARFGLVVWGANLHSCSGAGEAVRSGDTLTLAMTGDSACRIEARLSGDGTVTLASPPPAGCAYYCGARARLDGATFTRVGATKDEALKAKDLAGDSLCAGEG